MVGTSSLLDTSECERDDLAGIQTQDDEVESTQEDILAVMKVRANPGDEVSFPDTRGTEFSAVFSRRASSHRPVRVGAYLYVDHIEDMPQLMGCT